MTLLPKHRRIVLCAVALAGCASRTGPIELPQRADSIDRLTQRSSFTTLFSFSGRAGKAPYAALIAAGGTLYGTTYGGGTNEGGTAFSFVPSGAHRVLHSFKGGSDGSSPEASLLDVDGTFYGTTVNGGGPGDEGTVFTVSAAGNESVLYRFRGGRDGANPYAGLVRAGGTLYGTTAGGGTKSLGTVFTISSSGRETVLHSFGKRVRDGATPAAPLTPFRGTLYGTTSFGGAFCATAGCGTVFAISPQGTERVLYSFGGGNDGAMPAAPLTVLKSTLYGTTRAGGASNDGTVFAITPNGKVRILHAFKGGADGAAPLGLTAVGDTLYGVTSGGGSRRNGTIFTIAASGDERVLYAFKGGSDGAMPEGGLLSAGGKLYGTTAAGGSSGAGTIFSIAP